MHENFFLDLWEDSSLSLTIFSSFSINAKWASLSLSWASCSNCLCESDWKSLDSCFKRYFIDFISLSLEWEEWADIIKVVLKVIYLKKDRCSNEGRFPGKGGESLGSLKYQAFPSQILSFKTFKNLSLSNSLRAQPRIKTQFFMQEKNAKQ